MGQRSFFLYAWQPTKWSLTGLSLDELLWQTVDYKPCINHFTKPEQVPAKTQTSLELAKKLKKQGFKFLGPTIVYSLMQAAGLVNDHLVGCQA